jgi:hypothetical protein
MKQEEFYQMSKKEIMRMDVVKRVLSDRSYTIGHASAALSLSRRQVKRLVSYYRKDGPQGLISRKRGRVSNRKTPGVLRQRILGLIDKKYKDFSYTLISETLKEDHAIDVSRELIRGWLIETGMRKARRRKGGRVHQPRGRRTRFGELIQIDGSPHEWFEDRGPSCTLIEFIDDATSTILYMRFVEEETTQAYMEALRVYVQSYGLPLALYSDRHSIFRKPACETLTDNRWSQFERAVRTLEIDMIHANSPQAKGRVERSFATHQDRLVKKLRLAGISTIQDGNAFLEQYISQHNQKFSVKASDQQDAHAPFTMDRSQLDLILSQHYNRKISKNLTVQFENQIYRIITKGPAYAMRGARVTVVKSPSNIIVLIYQGKKLDYQTIHKSQIIHPPENRKSVDSRVNKLVKLKTNKPSPNHPWRHMRV